MLYCKIIFSINTRSSYKGVDRRSCFQVFTLFDEGQNIDLALPSTPVEILGMNNSAFAGDDLIVVESEEKAKEISKYRIENDKSKQAPLISANKESAFNDGSMPKELAIGYLLNQNMLQLDDKINEMLPFFAIFSPENHVNLPKIGLKNRACFCIPGHVFHRVRY